jgi:dihydrolipoamide dehydrogenase
MRCEHLLLATGSEAGRTALHALRRPGGLEHRGALAGSLPEHLVVVGAGYIGLELGTAYRKLGARVTVVEAAGRVLPAYDAELTRPVARRLKRLGVDLHLEASVLGLSAGRRRRAHARRPAAKDRRCRRPRAGGRRPPSAHRAASAWKACCST